MKRIKVFVLLLIFCMISTIVIRNEVYASNVYEFFAHSGFDGAIFKTKGNGGWFSSRGCSCTVKVGKQLDSKGRMILKIKLYDREAKFYRVNTKVKVKLKKVGYNEWAGKFDYDSGIAAASGKGKIWFVNKGTFIKLGLTDGEKPYLKKSKLKWVN